MARSEQRKVGERGQVTLPKELREKLNIQGGDEVLVHEEDGKNHHRKTREPGGTR